MLGLGFAVVGLLDCWIVGLTRVGINLRVDPTTRVVPTRVVPTRVVPTGKTAAIDQWLIPTAMIPQKKSIAAQRYLQKTKIQGREKRGN